MFTFQLKKLILTPYFLNLYKEQKIHFDVSSTTLNVKWSHSEIILRHTHSITNAS